MLKSVFRYLICKYRYRKVLKIEYPCKIGISSYFEGNNFIQRGSHFVGEMGYGSYIGSNCDVIANIGRFTSIAPRVTTNPGRHPSGEPFVTTCPLFYSSRQNYPEKWVQSVYFSEIAYVPLLKHISISIGNDCWIGDGAFIVGGVKIGDGSIVLAHSVVTKDVEPYSIVGGVPAKIVRYRYSGKIISKLLQFQWWNKDLDWLKSNTHLLRNIELLEKYIDDNKETNS